MALQQIFISNLKRIRKEKRITQEKLAELCDTDTCYIGQIETLRRFPSIHFIEKNISVTPDVWLKRKKWFWCNSQEYEKYMKKRK